MKPTPIPTRSLPELPSPAPLPSGPPYIRPMKITAISSLICYSYSVNMYNAVQIHIDSHQLTTDRALHLYRPKPRAKADYMADYRVFLTQWAYGTPNHIRYFRTIDDVYLDAFLKQPYTQRYHPEFPRIRSIYPEYFI